MKYLIFLLLALCPSLVARSEFYRIVEETTISTPFPPTESYIRIDRCEYKQADNSRFFTNIAAVFICGFVLYWWLTDEEKEDGAIINFVFET